MPTSAWMDHQGSADSNCALPEPLWGDIVGPAPWVVRWRCCKANHCSTLRELWHVKHDGEEEEEEGEEEEDEEGDEEDDDEGNDEGVEETDAPNLRSVVSFEPQEVGAKINRMRVAGMLAGFYRRKSLAKVRNRRRPESRPSSLFSVCVPWRVLTQIQ